MSTTWDESTAVRRLSDHTYEANLRDDWCNGTVPHGGYVTSCLMRLATAHFQETLGLDQRHTMTMHVEFLRKTETGLTGTSGNTTAHRGAGCQSSYGRCEWPDVKASFQKAMVEGETDLRAGGQWYWDAETRLFWTWDTPELIVEKISCIVTAKGLDGIMAWSRALDSYDWSHLKAMQEGIQGMSRRRRRGHHGMAHLGSHHCHGKEIPKSWW